MLRTGTVIVAAFIVSFAPAVSSAQAGRRFDLVCTGVKTTLSDTTPFQGIQEPIHKEWMIDLERGVFCEAGCYAPSRVASVSEDDIVLWDTDAQQVTEKGTYVRSTGEFQSLKQQKGSLYSEMVVAKCIVAPFKAFAVK